MNRVKIQPTQNIRTESIFSFTITNLVVNLFNGAHSNVSLFDSNNNFLQSINIIISKEEYEKWGSDDNYMVNLIATKMGFQLEGSNTISTINGITVPSVTYTTPVNPSNVVVVPPTTSTSTDTTTTSTPAV